MAAEVSLPVCEVCDPRRGRHMLPVSTRYASAAASRMVSNASRRAVRFCERSVTSSSSRDLISVPSCSRCQVAQAGHQLVGGAIETLGLAVDHVDEAPQEALALVAELGAVRADALGEDAEGFEHRVDGVVGIPDVAGVELVALGGRAVEGCVLADRLSDGLGFAPFDVLDDVHDDLLTIGLHARGRSPM